MGLSYQAETLSPARWGRERS